jgi:hypothetical protein
MDEADCLLPIASDVQHPAAKRRQYLKEIAKTEYVWKSPQYKRKAWFFTPYSRYVLL